MKKLSVIILTRNEEKNIKDCIESVSFAHEIIVIDDNSNDKTSEIAKKYGAKVYMRRLDDFATQRNFGLTKVTGDWVLYIDADERVSRELAHEIVDAINKEDKYFYKIPRKNKIFGKYLEHTDWYPDYQYRLFEKGEGKWGRKVHEQLETKRSGKELERPLMHDNYETVQQFIDKNFGIYADYEAELLISSGYKIQPFDLIGKPVNEFLRRFFATRGYLDGIHGLVASALVSFGTFVVYAKVWEKQGFRQESLPLKTIEKEFSTIGRDIQFWVKNSMLATEKNALVKFIKKIVY
jgi:glycosyltransferase involved in cell wall biosynthesis